MAAELLDDVCPLVRSDFFGVSSVHCLPPLCVVGCLVYFRSWLDYIAINLDVKFFFEKIFLTLKKPKIIVGPL